MNKKKVWVLLTVVLLLAATASWATRAGKSTTKTTPAAKGKTTEKPKEHQATGTVGTTSLVISKGAGASKSEWTFVVNDKTKTQGTLAKDAKAVVYYHQEGDQKIADRVKVLSATGSAGAAKGLKAAKTKEPASSLSDRSDAPSATPVSLFVPRASRLGSA